MDFSILVPTCKPKSELGDFLKELANNTPGDVPIIMSHLPVSAATNRNFCLLHCKTEYAIMIDDDMTGFFPRWTELMLEPFNALDSVAMVSARLMRSSTEVGVMMNIPFDAAATWQVVKNRFLPSACIAFRNDGCRFDENFIGSSWEDTDFCVTLQRKYPYGLFIINDQARLIHKNDQKNGNPEVYGINREYFGRKHGRIP